MQLFIPAWDTTSGTKVLIDEIICVFGPYNPPCHDEVIKWKHFPRYWPFVRGIHRASVNSPHKGQWRGALMCPLICDWINGWVNNHEADHLRRHQAHYDVTVILLYFIVVLVWLMALNEFIHTRHSPMVLKAVHFVSQLRLMYWLIECLFTFPLVPIAIAIYT